MTFNKTITFKAPAFADDQLAGGRYIYPVLPLSFLFGGRGTIIIRNGIMTYKESCFSSPQPKSFNLRNISKILVVRTKYARTAKNYELTLKIWHASNYLEVFLINKNGEKHILIPLFVDSDVFLSRRQWVNFLNKLKKYTCLPVETTEITASDNDAS
jgi:hypothetical protein